QEAQTHDHRMDGSPVASHDTRYLAEIATFRIGDRLSSPADLHHKAVFVNINAVNRHARFDAKDIEYFKVGRDCPSLGEKFAKLFALFSRANHIPASHV